MVGKIISRGSLSRVPIKISLKLTEKNKGLAQKETARSSLSLSLSPPLYLTFG